MVAIAFGLQSGRLERHRLAAEQKGDAGHAALCQSPTAEVLQSAAVAGVTILY